MLVTAVMLVAALLPTGDTMCFTNAGIDTPLAASQPIICYFRRLNLLTYHKQLGLSSTLSLSIFISVAILI